MPKEKTTRKAAPKSKADGGKKKKGKLISMPLPALLLTPVDPNAPKRGLSAYMFFANEQREKVREDNPGIKFGEFALLTISPSSSNLDSNHLQARSASFSERSGRP